jgi:hypothetical protein
MAVGCKKCPVFSVCPAKSLIGDYKPDAGTSKGESPSAAKNKRAQK